MPNPSTPASRGWALVPAPTEPVWGSLEWAARNDDMLYQEWVREESYISSGLQHGLSYARGAAGGVDVD